MAEDQNKTLEAIKKSIDDQTKILSAKPKKDIEGDRERKSENKKFLDELKSIIGAAVGGVGKAGKGAGKMLAKFLSFGLKAIMLPFLGLIGAIAGIFSGIMMTKEAKFLGGIMKTLTKSALGFVTFMGRIAKWMLSIMPGGKLITKVGTIFGNIGKSMTTMVSGWGKKLSAVMAKLPMMATVAKFVAPLARIGFWLFAGYSFLKGWSKADEIFGKEDGGATLVEKFAGGIGGFIDFLSFGFIKTEDAAKVFKTTFDAFELLITDPAKAWKEINKWWENFSFDKTIVQPMVEMFEKFPETVEKFIDGPLSNFGSNVSQMLKDFVFGKKENAEDAKTGGLLGLIKGMFTAKNISNAIEGFAKMTAGFYKMVGKLVLIPLFGTGEIKWTKPEEWGGLFGWLVQRFINIETEGDALVMGTGKMVKGIAIWIKNIFWHDDGESGLIQKALKWINENFLKVHWPDVDFASGIKDTLRPLLKKMAKVGLAPAGLSEWVGLPKPKPIIKEGPAEPTQVQKGLLNRIKFQERQIAMNDTHRGVDKEGGRFGISQGKDRKEIIAELQKELIKTGYSEKGITPVALVKTKDIKEMNKSIVPRTPWGEGTSWDSKQTRLSSLTGLTDDTQKKTAILASMVKGLNLTSGWRSQENTKGSMENRVDPLQKGYSNAFLKSAGLTPEEMSAGKGTDLRKSGVKKMIDAGYMSKHQHGDAVDFSKPSGWNAAMKSRIEDAFPGAKVLEEGDHIHMQFNKKNTGMQLAQMQADAGMVPGGGGGSTSSNNSSTTINQGTQIAMTSPVDDASRRETEGQTGGGMSG